MFGDLDTAKSRVGGKKVDFDTIGIFTGLHDEHGQPIYEGDIVCGRIFYVIVWDDEGACFKMKSKGGKFVCNKFSASMKHIVGNIHEKKYEKLWEKI